MVDQPDFSRIRAVLGATRRRLRLAASVRGVGWLVPAVGATLLGVVLLAAAGLGPWWRLAGWGLVGAVALGVTLRTWVLPVWRVRRDEVVAAHLEAGVPGLRDGLLACVQFERHWPAVSGSTAMVVALTGSVAGRLEGASMQAVTPLSISKAAWRAVGAVALAWGLVAAVAPTTLARGWTALVPSHLQGARKTGPLVGDLVVTLHYPEYTAREPRTIPNSGGDIEAPKGTRIEIRATTLQPARAAWIRFAEGELPLAVDEAREVRGEFVMAEAGIWRFAVEDVSGDALEEDLERRLRLELDRPPTVTLHLPAEDLELEDLRAVPVAYDARDDFGLGEVSVVISLANDVEHPEKLGQPGVSGLRHEGADEVDLRVIQAQPGDRIALFVEAFDNNAVDGKQRGLSATRYITVHSPQAKHYELSERLKETVEALLGALGDRLVTRYPGSEDPPLPARIGKNMETTDKAAAELAGVVEDMVGDPLTPEEVRLGLAGRLGSLEKAAIGERRYVEPNTPALERRADPVVRRAAKHNEEVVDQLEQAILLVEAMVARLALEDMAALTDELQAARERLTDLVKQLKQNPDDAALKARVMRDLHRLRDRIKEIRERMRALAKKVPEEFLNLEGMKKDEVAKGLQNTEDQLDQLEKLLEEGKIDEALQMMDEMEAMLDELSGALDKDLQDLHQGSNPELQKALSELMDQARDLKRRQEEVGKRTDEMAEREREALQKLLEEELGKKLAKIEEDAAALRLEMEKIDPEQLGSLAGEELEHLRERVDQLNDALKNRRLLEALEMSDRAMDDIGDLDRYTSHVPRSRGAREPIRESRRLNQDVMEGLAELLRDAQKKSQQQGEPQQMQQLSQDQQDIAEATRRLQQRLQQQAQQMPGLADKPMQSVENARQSMEQAGQQLKQRRPGHARPGQQQAISELDGLMEGLKKANQPQRADRGQGRRPNSRDRVEIPDAEDHESPAEFREELLKAMKEKPTDGFREQVKRYYESLVE